MNALTALHLGASIVATVGAFCVRAWVLGVALAGVVAVDLVYLLARGWPQDTLAALVGPASVVLAAALTFGVRPSHAFALTAPIFLLAPYILAEGPRLGSSGIAWLLVGAHVYAALVGLVVLVVGHDRAPRLHVRLVGLFLATSAPSAYGWTCRALGASMRPAAVLDCVFLTAIVVWSLAAWKTRPST
jgi:hypothetical protein